jgi:hypothetical protein
MSTEKNKITIWAESEAEAQEFLSVFGADLDFIIEKIFIAKKSSGKRDVGFKYFQGSYYPYDFEKKATIDTPITAPLFITDLVQWCSPDIIIATDKAAILTLELTFHILTFNNVAQRIPRMIRSAACKVPSIIFQKVNYDHLQEVTWFTKTFAKATIIYETPCLSLLFDDSEYDEARAILVGALNSFVCEIDKKETISYILNRMMPYVLEYSEKSVLFRKNGVDRKWITITESEVIVSIGVRDNCALTGIKDYGCQGDDQDKILFRKNLSSRPKGEKGCVWLSKGTGGMDPYPGLVKMCEILFCYNDFGKKTKKLTSSFSNLPISFWWFAKNPNEIYYKLIHSFSDKVVYSKTFN